MQDGYYRSGADTKLVTICLFFFGFGAGMVLGFAFAFGFVTFF